MLIKKFQKTCLALAFVAFSSSLSAATPEIRKITPPNLEAAHLGQKILCHRPMRHGAPNMSVEQKEGKVIGHNYGHGGSGWTLGPGCADYVNNLMIKSSFASDLAKDTPITVIGGGCLGLYTAYDLYKKGYTNITIVSERFEGLTSHNAGGLIAPVSMDNDPAMQKIIDQIGIDAYKFYATIANKKNADFKEGAVIVPTYFKTREKSGLEAYVAAKIMQPAKDVVLDFGNGTTQEMVSYDDGIFVDTAKMMVALTDFLKSKNVKFVEKKINSFSEISDKYIVNCTGLVTGKLYSDEKMVSVQGHLIMLKDQNPKDMQYMVLTYFGKGKTKVGKNIERSFYIFPKHLANTGVNDVGVVGGTFIEDATEATPHEEEFDIMLKGAKDFYGIK